MSLVKITFAAMSWSCLLLTAAIAADPTRIELDASVRETSLNVLRKGLRGPDFWPAIHAAEALTLAGQGSEVREFLTPLLLTEKDDQRRCGLARELFRAGDHDSVAILLKILTSADKHGHVHAAESLFKIRQIGDGVALQNALETSENLTMKMMAAAALIRQGNTTALQTVRAALEHTDPKHSGIAAWIIGQVGDASDIPRLKAALPRIADAPTRANFEHALALLGDQQGIDALLTNLSSEDTLIRTYAATFAGDARIFTAADRLKSLLNDSFPDAQIRAAQSLLNLSAPAVLPYSVRADVVFKELNRGYCWFHPRVAAMPGFGNSGKPAVIMTIQKHLAADDHYSGMYFLQTKDLGKTWTGPTEIPELAWRQGDNQETIAVCDVSPGWLTKSKQLLLIGIKLRYSPKGAQLLDQPRSHECAYATYTPETGRWTSWKMLDMPDTNGKFHLVAPGCVQWIEKSDGTLLIPAYFQRKSASDYTTTVLHCAIDGGELKYLEHGDELTRTGGRGLYEPSLALYQGQYFLTLRHDTAAFVTVSSDGLHFGTPEPWTFDDGKDLGSYNTQAHWLVHSGGLFLAYTRRGAGNDHIARNRAPIFISQVDPQTRRVLRATEQRLLPERGVMLGNFGAASISPQESWVTDAEFLVGDQPHPRGADGTVWLGRVTWSSPNRLIP